MRERWAAATGRTLPVLAVLAAVLIGFLVGNLTRPNVGKVTKLAPIPELFPPPSSALEPDTTSAPARRGSRASASGAKLVGIGHGLILGVKLYGVACGGRVAIRYRSLSTPRGTRGKRSGLARFRYDPARPLDASRYSDCSITINSRLDVPVDWYCGIAAHEYGHLRGRGHVSNPRLLMYRRLTARNLPRACRNG